MVASYIKKIKHSMLCVTDGYLRDITNTVCFPLVLHLNVSHLSCVCVFLFCCCCCLFFNFLFVCFQNQNLNRLLKTECFVCVFVLDLGGSPASFAKFILCTIFARQ